MSKTLVAYDYSGSTEGNDFYHTTVQTILQQYTNYDVILWSNKLKVSSAEELKRINQWREGDGGTQPIVIAKHLSEIDFHGDLVLITDGQIFERYVREVEQFMNDHEIGIRNIDCYLIQTCGDKLDATVIAPFLRFSHIVYFYDEGQSEPRILVQGGKSEE